MKRPKKDAPAQKKPGKVKSETSRRIHAEASGLPAPDSRGNSQIPGQPLPDKEIVTFSPEETFELGRSISCEITGPAIILLSGDLGAGKTLLTKGVAAGLDIDPADVTSPSFTLINLHHGRLRLYHVDLYRLDSSTCAVLGLEEIFEDPKAVVVIEWAERLPRTPRQAIRIHIEYVNDSSRRMLISGWALRESDRS